MVDQPVDLSSAEDGQRCCAVCGEPIYSRAKFHPACAMTQQMKPAVGDAKRKQAPQKACAQCGHKSHVRILACGRCGAMF